MEHRLIRRILLPFIFFFFSISDSSAQDMIKKEVDTDTIKKEYSKKYPEKIILSLKYSEAERFIYFIKNNVPDSLWRQRVKESNFIVGGAFLGLEINYWRVSFHFGTTPDATYLTTDGIRYMGSKSYKFGFSFDKLYISPALESFYSYVKDTNEVTTRSLKGLNLSVSGRYYIYNKNYVELLFNNYARQLKSAFSVSCTVVPFYQKYSPMNDSDSIVRTEMVPYWNEYSGIRNIHHFGLDGKLNLNFNLIFLKKFNLSGMVSQGIRFQGARFLSYDNVALASSSGSINSVGEYVIGLGYGTEKFFLKIMWLYSIAKSDFRTISINTDYTYFALKTGFRFRQPKFMQRFYDKHLK